MKINTLMALLAAAATMLVVTKFVHELIASGKITQFDTNLALGLAIVALTVISSSKNEP